MQRPTYLRSDLTQIVERASTVNDRLQHPSALSDEGYRAGLAAQRLQAWVEAIGVSPQALAKRFAWDGLETEDVRQVLAPTPGIDGAPPPDWLDLLVEAYGRDEQALKARFEALPDSPDRVLDPHHPVPFELLYIPLIRTARQWIRRRAGTAYALLDAPAHVVLERTLLKRLATICERAFYADFSVYRACQPHLLTLLPGSTQLYNAFITEMVHGRLWRFFRRYSVAARLCAIVTVLWVEMVHEFIQRIANDLPMLEGTFGAGEPIGTVATVTADLSDPHGGGRSVIILTFSTGLRIVYKPRPLGLDQFFSEFLTWLNTHGGRLPIRPLRVLSRPSHGWIEYAAQRPCADEAALRRFYIRCGMLLSLVYALNGSDFHMENLIAAGEHPMLIDMEALLGHRFRLERLNEGTPTTGNATFDQYEGSVLKVGLLPFIKVGKQGRTLDVGGLGGTQHPDEDVHITSLKNVNTDQMRLARRAMKPGQPGPNRAILAGKEAPIAPYAEDIVEGFRHTYELLLAHRESLLAPGGLLSRLKHQDVRFIFRNTSLYASALHRSLHPKYLREGVDRAIQLDVLCKPLLSLDEKPSVWPIHKAEQESLECLDIPLFTATADSTALTLPNGAVIVDCFERTAYDETIARFCALHAGDLAHQCDLIRGAIYANAGRCLHSLAPGVQSSPSAPLTPPEAIGRAQAIAETLRTRARALPGGGVTWFSIKYVPRVRRYQLNVGNPGLFDGCCGIALFLAALERVAPGQGARAFALAALKPLQAQLADLGEMLERRTDVDIGGATGIGSIIYALARVAPWLDAPELLAETAKLATFLTPEVFAKDHTFDVCSGTAGTILGLLALYEATGDAAFLAQAERGGAYLLEQSMTDPQKGYTVWRAGDKQPDVGFAHGMAGIAYALTRLHRTANPQTKALVQAAADAVAFEQAQRPRTGTTPTEAIAAWSYGATGIGLARLGGLDVLDTPEIRQDIEAALAQTHQHLFEGDDTLCCGRMGRVEFLLAAGQRLYRPELIRAAATAAAAPFTGGYDTGWGPGYQDVGLFQGLAGIGYQLLRVTHPDRLPSLLLWA